MSLTGRALQWLTIVAALAAFVAVVLRWPTLGGRGGTAGRLLVRAGALAGVNVLVVLSVAVQLNDQYLFYAGWPDLAGSVVGASAATDLPTGPAARTAADATASGHEATAGALLPLPRGSAVRGGTSTYTVTGPLSGITGQVMVSVPAGYGRDTARRYPVLETFSGYPGSLAQWNRTMQLPQVLAAAEARHRLGPTLVVSPQTEVPAGADSECVNGPPGRPQLETWLARDVPDWVDTHFRVRTDRSSWATIGLSAGGWCAAMTAMLHPATYGAAIVLGGYFRPDFASGDRPGTGDTALAARYDLVALTERAPPPVALWVETSHADPLSYTTSAALLEAARPPLSVTATVLQDAGHRIGVWRALLPQAITWLAADVPGFHA